MGTPARSLAAIATCGAPAMSDPFQRVPICCASTGTPFFLPVDIAPGYAVSDHGTVKSILRVVSCVNFKGNRYTRIIGGRILRAGRTAQGYQSVSLKRLDGTVQSHCVHRLVAEAFLPMPDAPVVHTRHLSTDRTDDRLSNLALGTAADNFRDIKWTGPLRANRRLRPEAVREIKALIAQGLGDYDIAPICGVQPSTVWFIRNGKQHSDV